jgi:hypothetical protein
VSLDYTFLRETGAILNSGQARTVLLSGSVNDLFFIDEQGGPGAYRPLIDFLIASWGAVAGKMLVVYELNGPVRFVQPEARQQMCDAWVRWRTGMGSEDLAIKRMLMSARERAELEQLGSDFESHLRRAQGNPSLALELLRQMCVCSRTQLEGKPCLEQDLIILVEGADMLIPQGEIARLSDVDRHRVAICSDWFSDPQFMDGQDAVILVAESASLVNHRVARLPQILSVAVGAPDESVRRHCIDWYNRQQTGQERLQLWGSEDDLARLTAGLSIHALLQLLKGASHGGAALMPEQVIDKVESHIQGELGDDVVSFKKPRHRLDDVVGFEQLKHFLREQLIPRVRSVGPDALAGAAVCGPIGAGKTFIFEAVAAELDVVVLVLKNIRSKWFGETDVVFERLGRVVRALSKVLIFVDEADTQFGGVGGETHSTERRLTGKIQAMMSDPTLRGKVVWLLMTARIQLLSPDIRRPGRVGDLIIPVLDPEDAERIAFCRWMVEPVLAEQVDAAGEQQLLEATAGYSAASYASLRSELIGRARGGRFALDTVLEIVADHLPPPLGDVRRYQTLQALLNCTRRSLLPDSEGGESKRDDWALEIRQLEARGVR